MFDESFGGLRMLKRFDTRCEDTRYTRSDFVYSLFFIADAIYSLDSCFSRGS